MKKIKINFCDFGNSFSPTNNLYYQILSKHFDIDISDNPDYIFYSDFGIAHKNIPSKVIKINIINENIRPNFTQCDYAIGYDYINYEDRYFRHPMHLYISKNLDQNKDYFNRKFCNFIYSNCKHGSGAIIRIDFCKLLSQYKKIDCPGKCLNNMKDVITPRDKNWRNGKLPFIRKYKFTIAFENSSCIGHISEKFFDPINNGSIPIYWGDPKISREFNTKAFINCHDFNNFDEVVDFVKYLDNNGKAYLDMLYANPLRDDYKKEDHDLSKFLIHIIEHGTPNLREDPYGYVHLTEDN